MTIGSNAQDSGVDLRRLVASALERAWRSRNPVSIALYPVSIVYRTLMATRRLLYRGGVLHQQRAARPVVVVGNITVGGSGKTPFTAWLCDYLVEHGHRPGIVIRGYRGRSPTWPLVVTPRTPASIAGDEAVLLARLTGLPVVAGPDRAADCRLLLERHDCDVIVCDDGLQHLALARDFEIVLHDERLGQGNGWCLPAGPLREPVRRLAETDMVIPRGNAERGFTARIGALRRLDGTAVSIGDLAGARILAMTAIARPERFFDSLAALGLQFERLALPDHHEFRQRDITTSSYDAILVTEKDAVKLADFDNYPIRVVSLYLDVAPAVTKHLEQSLLPRLNPTWSNSTS